MIVQHEKAHAMKTLLTRTALLIALATSFGFARASEPATPLRTPVASTMERELEHQINKYVSYPLHATNMDGEVFVSFVIDAEGRVQVLNAYSGNDQLCAYVLEKLARIDIGSNPGGVWKTTHLRFSFHPEV